MKKTIMCLVAAAMTLCLIACGQNDLENNPILTEKPALTPDSSGNSPGTITDLLSPGSVTEEDLPPQEGMVRSRLTNEWVDQKVADTRPIAVLTPNETGAIPHYNLSKASILYEANVEYRVSRLMAIYEDWADLEVIGNVRSLRSYFAYWSFEWDAFLVHSGGPYFVNDLLAEPTTQNVNDHLGTDTAAFFRDNKRSMPHNLFVTGSGIKSVVEKKGYSLNYRGLADTNHYRFTDSANQNTLAQYGDDAKSAIYIDMSGCYPLTRCYFEYDDNDGLYYRSQHLSGGPDGPHVDAVTGEQLTFKNILVQYVTYDDLGEGYLVFQCHDTTQDGWYFTNGRGIHITWEKNSDYSSTRYYDDYGNEISMNTGKTMICIVLDGDNFTFR